MTVIIHDLSPETVQGMVQTDLSRATERPPSPIGEFAFHDCRCGIGSFVGCPHWERHNGGDELLLVLSGESNLTVFEEDGPVSRKIGAGTLAIVPQGHWHCNNAPDGVTMLFMTPSEGNEHSSNEPSFAD
jgi:mannose-6-phosphate isomerase-like protein (cupin superfamily)